jgi:nuclear pore complex protein Nup98-Nup96
MSPWGVGAVKTQSPSGPTTGNSLFGQQSQLVMGQQPLLTRTSSNPMSSTPSFGNTSPVVYGGGGGGVFGANTSNGQSSFGQVSQIGSSSPGRVGVFGASLASNNQSLLGAQGGQPLYGQTSQPSQSLFGSRSLPNTNGQVFGQTSSPGSTNTFGQSGQSSWLGNR